MCNNTQWTREETEAQEGVLSKVTQLEIVRLEPRQEGCRDDPDDARAVLCPMPIRPGPEGGSQRAAGLPEPVGSTPAPSLWDPKTNQSSGVGDLPGTSPDPL